MSVNKFITKFISVILVAVMINGLFLWETSSAADTNVALNKTATASAYNSAQETPAKAVDGLTTTKWCDTNVGDKWLKIDLGNAYYIKSWVVKHAGINGEPAVYNTRDFKLQKSADGSTWTDVDSVTNNTASMTERAIPVFKTRYVRLYITYPTQDISQDHAARIYEFEVYGSDTVANPSIVSLNKTATASAYNSAQETPAKAVDGLLTTKWCDTNAGDKWLKIDMGSTYDISRWVVKHAGAAGEPTIYNTRDFKLQKSTDGSTWTDVDYVDLNGSDITDRIVPTFNARYVRLYITYPTGDTNVDHAARIYEFEVYGISSIANQSFENPEGWTYGGMSRSMDMAHSGSHSLKSTVNGTAAITSNTYTVIPYADYKLSGWIYKANNNGGAYLDLNDISGEPQIGVWAGSGAGSWTHVSSNWNSGSNTSVNIRCVTDSGLDAAAYFDEVSLVANTPDLSFENAEGWSYYSMSRSTDIACTGSYSLKSTVNGTTAVSNHIDVIPFTDYKLSVWIYKTNNSGNVYLDMNDLLEEPQIGVWDGYGAGIWTNVNVVWNSGSNTSVRLRCVTDGGLDAAAYFDDISLVTTNPDLSFESDEGWTYNSMTRSVDRAHSGSYSLKSTVDGTYAKTNPIAVSQDTWYELSCWIYKTNTSGSAYLDMYGTSGGIEQLGIFSGVSATGVWIKVSRAWYSGTNTSVRLRCVTDDGLNAAVYFDGISLVPSDGATAGNPEIISTVYPTEDIVVVDFDVADFGADNTGSIDSTEAIQMALDNCQRTGGGTVWMPAGTYKVSNRIYIPRGCYLRGDWRDPDSGSGSYGTVISADVGEGFEYLFALKYVTGGLYGLTIYYPNQNASSPIDTGWVVKEEKGHNHHVKNITLLNAYKGFFMGEDPEEGYTANPEVSCVKGTVLYHGLSMHTGVGAGGAHNIKFSNSYWANAGQTYNAPTKSTLDTWTRANGTAFTFGRTEMYSFHHLEASDYNIGIHFDDEGIELGTPQWGGNFALCSIQNTNIALKADSAGYNRFNSFLRCTLNGSTNSIQNNVSGHTILVTDCSFSGLTSGSVTISNPGTSPTFYTTSTLPKVTRAVLYDVTKSPHNAPFVSRKEFNASMPDVDATSSIQAALTDAGNDGGGVVYLPAGWYRINGHLTIPANVELRGACSGKTGQGGSYGTWLFAYEGENTETPLTDTACVTINGNGSGINGIQVIWPNNPWSRGGTEKSFPYAFRINGVDDTYIINTNFKNPYLGVDIANGSDRHHLRSLYGSFSYNFIRVGTCSEGWIEELYDINPCPRLGIGDFGMTIPWMDNSIFLTYTAWMQTNDAIIINGASNEHLMSILFFRPGNSIYVSSGTADIWNIGADQSGYRCVYAPSGSVKIMNSTNTMHGSYVNAGNGIMNSYNEGYVIGFGSE